MARTYRELMVEVSPAWLSTATGTPFLEGFGEMKDAMLWRMLQAVRARFPSLTTDDCLAKIGWERQLPRASGESRESYAARLAAAWDAWEEGGSTRGILRALYAIGYDNVHIAIFNGYRFTLDGDGDLVETALDPGGWRFLTSEDDVWNKFVVLFPLPLLQRWQDDGVPASNSDEANVIRSQIQKWKPGHMLCSEILIAEDASAERLLGYYPEGETMGTRPGTLGDRVPWTSWTP